MQASKTNKLMMVVVVLQCFGTLAGWHAACENECWYVGIGDLIRTCVMRGCHYCQLFHLLQQ